MQEENSYATHVFFVAQSVKIKFLWWKTINFLQRIVSWIVSSTLNWVKTRWVCSKVICAFPISLKKYLYYKILCFRMPIAQKLNKKYIVLIIVVLNLISIANTNQVGGRLMQNEYHIFYSVSPENQQIYLVSPFRLLHAIYFTRMHRIAHTWRSITIEIRSIFLSLSHSL